MNSGKHHCILAMILHLSLGICSWPLSGTVYWGRWTLEYDLKCLLLCPKKEVMSLIWWVHSKLGYAGNSQDLKAWQYGYHEKAFLKRFQQQLAGKIKTVLFPIPSSLLVTRKILSKINAFWCVGRTRRQRLLNDHTGLAKVYLCAVTNIFDGDFPGFIQVMSLAVEIYRELW